MHWKSCVNLIGGLKIPHYQMTNKRTNIVQVGFLTVYVIGTFTQYQISTHEMLDHRLRRWSVMKPTMAERLVSLGNDWMYHTPCYKWRTILMWSPQPALPSKTVTLNQCCFNVGPTSKTVGQHWKNIGSISRVCWVSSSNLAKFTYSLVSKN